MATNDALAIRMKTFYEDAAKTKLTRRMPVIIRLDGKAFHTFTSTLNKPFDSILTSCMQQTAKYLCENIQGCVLAYSQSDEISLLLIDYTHLDSCAWYDNEVMKMCSVSASMATLAFNRFFDKESQKVSVDTANIKYCNGINKARELGAMFDSRVFNIPKEEVTNYFYWRQRDAVRNSIQSAGQVYYTQKELRGMSNSDIIGMLLLKDIKWSEYPAANRLGFCVLRTNKTVINNYKGNWEIDCNIPNFKAEGRSYIEKLLNPEDT